MQPEHAGRRGGYAFAAGRNEPMNSDTSMPSPESVHISVLLNEAVDALAPKAGGRYLDGTVGMGGHSFAIMERTGGEGFLCGLDRDTQALELARIRRRA